MNRRLLISALLLGLCLTARAQLTYDIVRERNFWNLSDNVTGLRADSLSIARAELTAGWESGDYRETYEAPSLWRAGASASAINHQKRFSMIGSFSFDQMQGNDMCASMLVEPGRFPLDVIEFTPGRKTLQRYAFTGGISIDVAPDWRLGGNVSYKASNYAKLKDLRYTNYALDMTVAPAIQYHSGDFALGAAYLYTKTTESPKSEQIGTAESSYYGFLDKGLSHGVYQIWTGGGLHLDESGVNGFPIVEQRHAVSLQMQWRGLFAEAEVHLVDGEVGEKQQKWFFYDGNGARLRLYGLIEGSLRHTLRVEASANSLTNNENVLEKVTENGVTTTRIHGSNPILFSHEYALRPSYTMEGGTWKLSAGVDWDKSLSKHSQIYPITLSAVSDRTNGWLRGDVRTGRFEFVLGAAFSKGYASFTKFGSAKVEPYFLEEHYNKHTEYLDAPALRLDASVRYTIPLGIYFQLAGEYGRGFNIQYLPGTSRVGATFTFGYNF